MLISQSQRERDPIHESTTLLFMTRNFTAHWAVCNDFLSRCEIFERTLGGVNLKMKSDKSLENDFRIIIIVMMIFTFVKVF